MLLVLYGLFSSYTITVPMQTGVSMETLWSDTANTHAFVTSALIFLHCGFIAISCSSCLSGSVHVCVCVWIRKPRKRAMWQKVVPDYFLSKFSLEDSFFSLFWCISYLHTLCKKLSHISNGPERSILSLSVYTSIISCLPASFRYGLVAHEVWYLNGNSSLLKQVA